MALEKKPVSTNKSFFIAFLTTKKKKITSKQPPTLSDDLRSSSRKNEFLVAALEFAATKDEVD